MKETLKFLKFGLIGVASMTAISTLAISCKKSETVDTNNQEQNQEQIKQTLQAAEKAFTITPKGQTHSQVLAKDIEDNETELEKYFNVTPGADFGIDKGFTYTFKSAKPNGATSLDVVYVISHKDTKETKEKTITLTGFKDVNLIDYDLKNPADFFKIALDKNHLDTIAFFAQDYNFVTQDMFKTWTLNTDKEIYKATKTEQYLIFNGSKYYIWEVNFVEHTTKKPIYAVPSESNGGLGSDPINADFTDKGKQRLPFLYAIKEV